MDSLTDQIGPNYLWLGLRLAPTILLFLWILYQRVFSPFAKVPGPFWASLSRVWLAWHSYTGDLHVVMMRLHEVHGKVVRIAPGEVYVKMGLPYFCLGGIKTKTFTGVFQTSPPSSPSTVRNLLRIRELTPTHKSQVRDQSSGNPIGTVFGKEDASSTCLRSETSASIRLSVALLAGHTQCHR